MTRRLRTETPSLVAIVLMFAIAFASWSTAPDRIPMHWNDEGQIDRFGGKAEGLLLLPIVTAGLYVLLLMLPHIDSRYADTDPFSGPYLFLRTGLVGVL